MEEKPELSYFYCELYDLIYKHADGLRSISRARAARLIGRAYNIPRVLCMPIIKEMQDAGWIEKHNRFSIQLLKKPFNIRADVSKVNESLGLWG